MASKIVLVIALSIFATVVTGDDNCDCEDIDAKPLWDFFAEISEKYADNEADKDEYSVLPALMSPLLDCNCLEKNRKKREVIQNTELDSISKEIEEKESKRQENEMIISQEENVSSSEENDKIRFATIRSRRDVHLGTGFCPLGFVRVYFLCIREEVLEDDYSSRSK